MENLAFKNILPKIADNNFQGHRFALWGFILFTLLMSWRAIIHMLFEQYGFHQIANFQVISGEPDPMLLIYRFFSLWGFAQLIFCIVCWIVIFRYRALIPLMYLLWIFHQRCMKINEIETSRNPSTFTNIGSKITGELHS